MVLVCGSFPGSTLGELDGVSGGEVLDGVDCCVGVWTDGDGVPVALLPA
jgi:hypothetical protein